MVSIDVRPLRDEDVPAVWRLGSLAFGYADRTMPEGWGDDRPGRWSWGAFDEAGRLLGKASDRQQGHWFGGRVVPAAGVAGVATAPDARGRGVARALLTRLLAGARDRGAVISTLFDTTPFPYRRLGWEEVGTRSVVAVPTAALTVPPAPAGPGAGPGGGLGHTRPATEADLPHLGELYRRVARDSTGMGDRNPPRLADWDGISVAVEDGEVTGYLTWDRLPGYDAAGRLRVGDLIGLTATASVALLHELGGWSAVAPTTVFRLGDNDPLRWLTAITRQGTVERREPWMLRLIDAPAAVTARGFSPFLRGEAPLRIDDPECPWNSGSWRLTIEGGVGHLVPAPSAGPVIGPRGLALWYAGAATPRQLRRLGLLAGDETGDGLLAAATAGPAPCLVDYF